MATQTGYKVSELGMIPQDWDVVEFGEVVELFSSGSTPSRSQPQFFKGNNLWITSGELNYCVITDTIEKISDSAIEQSNLKKHPVGTFLMAITGLEAAGTRGSCAIVGAPATTNQSCMAIYPNERLKTEFLYQWYVLNGNQLAFKYCQGTKQLSYTASLLKKIPVLLPKSTSEQTAIATALSDTDVLISSLQTLIAKKKAIKLSVMQNLLSGKIRLPEFAQRPDGSPKTTHQTELGCVPEDWAVVELGDVGKTYGGLSGKNKSDFDRGDSFYVPFTNVMANLEVDKNQLGKVEVNEKQNAVLEGDLLFNGSSETPEEVCFASFVNFSLPNLFLNSFCFGFRLTKNTISPKYLAYWFRSEIGRKTIAFMSQGSTRYNISKSEFVKLKLVMPSKPEQTAIAQLLSDMDAEIESLEGRLKKTQSLKQGMMQALLTGKIRLPLE